MGFFRVMREGGRLWLPCTRARRYHAALATLLAIHRFPRLDGTSKARIDAELVQIFKPLGIYPWWRYRPDVPPTTMAADRAVAMYRLGIPTGIADLRWENVLHPWHRQSPTQIIQDFSAYHAATDDAIRFLASHGVVSPELKHFGSQWLERARAGAKPAHDA
jgi:hypothetical protein